MDQIGRRERPALEETFRLHGRTAYSVALSITQDSERAEQTVMTAFEQLTADARRGGRRSLRVGLPDATRRNAALIVMGPSPVVDPAARLGPGEVFRTLDHDLRDVLALALAGRCGSAEIAEITGRDEATVRLQLRSGLRHAVALLARDGATTS